MAGEKANTEVKKGPSRGTYLEGDALGPEMSLRAEGATSAGVAVAESLRDRALLDRRGCEVWGVDVGGGGKGDECLRRVVLPRFVHSREKKTRTLLPNRRSGMRRDDTLGRTRACG